MAGMNLDARKTKRGNQSGKVIQQPSVPEHSLPPLPEPRALVPKPMPQVVPTMLSLLKAIEPDTIYAGYDSTIPDTSTRIMTTLNRLGGRQVISAVKWAKALPGFRNLHLDDQMTLLQCSWLFLMSFGLGWRSYQQCNGNMLCFAPDLVINEERMRLPYMNDQCEQMLKISNEFVRLQVSNEEYLCMKVLLLLSTVPKDGLKSQSVFDELRMSYIKELGKAIVKREENSSKNWQRFYQLTKLLDSMHDMVGGLLNFCFYTFVNKSLSVEFPEMLAEIISNQLPKSKLGVSNHCSFTRSDGPPPSSRTRCLKSPPQRDNRGV
ncbi:LOW QUALITY PROTEIN: glucocorticoid receptor-like [Carassius auratus]|uniref:LOW QUALITY PROTEIN: glucocorticoid receptor-like n=1 Tax=Carassius auratus TaxID=7957 RepID=A0A6P6PH26_CARAU|nr:LOW QUALITY PROTEIN: glucocorticoid receptor-like [Carassius auratus]